MQLNNTRLKGAVYAALVCTLLTSCNRQGSLSDEQKAEVGRIAREEIEKMLEKEPAKFVAAIDKAMQQQQREAAQKVEQNATDSQQKFWDSKLIIGNPGAKVRFAVFIDPRDPVSQKFFAEVMAPLVKERSDVCFFIIPVSIYGAQEGKPSEQTSLTAAKALIAATWQSVEKALELWKLMQTIHQEYPTTLLLKHARDVGLDIDKLKNDIDSELAQLELVKNGQFAVDVGIPIQLPVIFILGPDGRMALIPPFVKERMVPVVNAVAKGKPWQQGVSEFEQQEGAVGQQEGAAKETTAPADARTEETIAPASGGTAENPPK
ncbi:MAG: hypothetical protein LBF66_02000 [Holosporales bacterium]|jgi:hypothetical protein|nr:hypothetical protein [Holosporales bacterium]